MRILCVGPQWRGSNAGGLFRALSRIGHLIHIVDENYYINLSNASFKAKLIDKIFRPVQIQEFNRAIIFQATVFNPDLILVYKGAFVLPETLQQLKDRGLKLVNFYPDVSFHTHGSLLSKTLPLYEHVFTTKTFGIEDMKNQLNIHSSSFIPHGFDPDLHRPIDSSTIDSTYFNCDVSFIGGYSEKKARFLNAIKTKLPTVQLKIWGGRWEACKLPSLQSSIIGNGIHGDLYVLGIVCSKINLGLLHEKVTGASSGDKITSRTFHIPGSGGFMLHERTEESVLYFKEDEEVSFFEGEEELCQKVKYYLENTEDRIRIQKQGTARAWNSHKLDHRAEMLIENLQKFVKI